MNIEIKVENSGIVTLPSFNHKDGGTLIVTESKKTVPFEIKRLYFITSITNAFSEYVIRGEHAHKKIEQVIFCVKGSFSLTLDDGKTKQVIVFDNPKIGIRLGPKLWHSMSKFSPDCVILVLSDSLYSEEDYIRNYDDFLKFIK